jgi:hypothetical protein
MISIDISRTLILPNCLLLSVMVYFVWLIAMGPEWLPLIKDCGKTFLFVYTYGV